MTQPPRASAIAHAQKMRRLFPDVGGDTQKTPAIIPQFELKPDPTGAIATFQPNGLTITAKNAFFQDLGTNGRKCFTCHQPGDGWSLSAQHAQERFDADPNEPLFRLVDGATCPSDDVSTYRAKRKAYILLLAKGLIRIGLPIPPSGLEFQISDVNDPYGCNHEPDDRSDRLYDRHVIGLPPTVAGGQSRLFDHNHGRTRDEPVQS